MPFCSEQRPRGTPDGRTAGLSNSTLLNKHHQFSKASQRQLSCTLKIFISCTFETQLARFSEQFRPPVTPWWEGVGVNGDLLRAGQFWAGSWRVRGCPPSSFGANSQRKRGRQPPRQLPFPSSCWPPWKVIAEHPTNSTLWWEAHETMFELNDKIWKTFDQSGTIDIQKPQLDKSDPRAPPAEEADKNPARHAKCCQTDHDQLIQLKGIHWPIQLKGIYSPFSYLFLLSWHPNFHT